MLHDSFMSAIALKKEAYEAHSYYGMKAVSTGRLLRFEGLLIFYEYLNLEISQQVILSIP